MKACIFDLDGTLTDTLDSLNYSVNETLKEMGLPEISRDQVELYVGNGARRLMERSIIAAGDTDATRIEEAMEIYGRIFGANCPYHVVPYDGIVPTLQTLKEKKIRLAVLSNKPHAQTVDVVREIFGDGIFDIVQGQTDAFPRKPDPTAVLAILEKFGVEPKDCMYIGDSEVDIATGYAAGAFTVGVDWGFRDREVLEAAHASVIISSPAELLSYL